MDLITTKKLSEAQGVWCPDCNTDLGCQYWSLGKSLALHRYGQPTHRPILWHLPDVQGER